MKFWHGALLLAVHKAGLGKLQAGGLGPSGGSVFTRGGGTPPLAERSEARPNRQCRLRSKRRLAGGSDMA